MAEIPSLLNQLTTEEKVALLSGRDVWRTAEVERLGIGSVKVTDGPNGAEVIREAGPPPCACRPPSGWERASIAIW